jgi:hypothetical protein
MDYKLRGTIRFCRELFEEFKGGNISKIKHWLVKIDNLLLKGKLQGFYSKIVDRMSKQSLAKDLEYKIVTHYRKDPYSELAKLCDIYGSDKGELKAYGHPYSWRSHTYTDYYSRLFGNFRNGITKVFECGLGTNIPDIPSSMGILGKPGASLRVWRDYFPNAFVWGADIDREVLFQEERIRTLFIDQLNTDSIRKFWEEVGVRDFDFMVDDGLHTFEAGSNLFLNSIDYLSPSGIYVIEDVIGPDLLRYKEFFKETEFIVDYVLMSGPNPGLADNNLVVLKTQG